MTRDEACRKIGEVIAAYSHIGPLTACALYGNGHINDTFLAVTQTGRRYILQRINYEVFPHPGQIMANIEGVTAHIRRRAEAAGEDPDRATLTIVRCNDGKSFFTDSIGCSWRMYDFVEGTVARDRVENADDFRACGKAFGRFQGLLCDYPAKDLYEAIPDFHNTPVRYEALMRAVRADACDRVRTVEKELEFVQKQSGFVKLLEQAHASGDLPLRVTHNDTKLNNILFDASTGAPVCVIDLDTVMPGYSVNDFGDSIRFGANTVAEDDPHWERAALDTALLEAYARGFLQSYGNSLCRGERELMMTGAMMMTLECGIRFLTDYLEGDHYFRIHRPTHNLDRCRTQLALFADMEKKRLQTEKLLKAL